MPDEAGPPVGGVKEQSKMLADAAVGLPDPAMPAQAINLAMPGVPR